MAEYKIPPMVNASCHFTLYDIVTAETLQSETAQTAVGAFTLSNLEDRTVMEESRRALQFLYNAKTRPGLENIMREVFEGL
jgi:dihydroorotase-like cyclic amidohydrolase